MEVNKKCKNLKGKELVSYTNEINEVMVDAIDKVIAISDKYSVDRDDAMKHFATTLLTMSEIATFKNYKKENG